MNTFITNSLQYYGRIFKTPADVLHHLFCIGGNGIDMTTQGYISNNYRDTELYKFPAPIPIIGIYPFSDFGDPVIEKYRGCREIGFKQSLQYLIDCIMITPDKDNPDVAKWKDNINVLIDVLNADTMASEFKKDDMESFLKFIEGDATTNQAPCDGTVIPLSNSVSKRWYFDVQWSDCPNLVKDEVRDIWRDHEFGNDNYIYKGTLDNEFFEYYPRIYMWLKHKGVVEDEDFIVHWWW